MNGRVRIPFRTQCQPDGPTLPIRGHGPFKGLLEYISTYPLHIHINRKVI